VDIMACGWVGLGDVVAGFQTQNHLYLVACLVACCLTTVLLYGPYIHYDRLMGLCSSKAEPPPAPAEPAAGAVAIAGAIRAGEVKEDASAAAAVDVAELNLELRVDGGDTAGAGAGTGADAIVGDDATASAAATAATAAAASHNVETDTNEDDAADNPTPTTDTTTENASRPAHDHDARPGDDLVALLDAEGPADNDCEECLLACLHVVGASFVDDLLIEGCHLTRDAAERDAADAEVLAERPPGGGAWGEFSLEDDAGVAGAGAGGCEESESEEEEEEEEEGGSGDGAGWEEKCNEMTPERATGVAGGGTGGIRVVVVQFIDAVCRDAYEGAAGVGARGGARAAAEDGARGEAKERGGGEGKKKVPAESGEQSWI
jgi:hypothetical protein